MPFRLLEHTADVAVELTGKTPAALLEAATLALRHLYLGRRSPAPDGRHLVQVSGNSLDEVLVRWANELIFLADARAEVAVEVAGLEVAAADDGRLTAAGEVGVAALGPALEPDMELKAATWHGLTVEKRPAGWRARLVLDV